MTTKKDYLAIAQAIKENMNAEHAPQLIALELANHFEKSNPRFDRKRFLKACGLLNN